MRNENRNQETTCPGYNTCRITILILLGSIGLSAQGVTIPFSRSNFHNPLKIDNKYLPLKPGTTKISNGTSDGDPTRDVFVYERYKGNTRNNHQSSSLMMAT